MSTVSEGYKLAVIGPDSTVVETFDLSGYDLTKQIAALDVMDDVGTAIAIHQGSR